MSVKIQTAVWELDLPHDQLLVLLALADHADDWGGKCYPGTRYLAWKTGYTQRHIQRLLRALEQAALIQPVAYAKGGRGHATEYRIVTSNGQPKAPYQRQRDDPDPPTSAAAAAAAPPQKGDKMSPFSTERVTLGSPKGDIPAQERATSEPERVTPRSRKGDTQVTPTTMNHQEPSDLNHQEPPQAATAAPAAVAAGGATTNPRRLQAEMEALAATWHSQIGAWPRPGQLQDLLKWATACAEHGRPDLLDRAIAYTAVHATAAPYPFLQAVMRRWLSGDGTPAPTGALAASAGPSHDITPDPTPVDGDPDGWSALDEDQAQNLARTVGVDIEVARRYRLGDPAAVAQVQDARRNSAVQ